MNQLAPESIDIARKVDQLLHEMSGELDASMNPHRTALRHLGVNTSGWTAVPYSDEAFRIWSDLLKRDDNDIETLHHMAIMAHAKAIDLEAGEDPAQSNSAWEEAMRHWYSLWQMDAFWDRIADTACKTGKRDVVDDLRARFPEVYLRVHYDVAFHRDTKTHRATYHIKMALASPFPEESKQDVRLHAYDRYVSGVPSNVWRTDTYDPNTIREGTTVIREFLDLDPGCVPALSDALRLEMRLLTARHHELQALGDDNLSERTRLLGEIERSATEWREFFDQMVGASTSLDEDIRQKLCCWYRVMGEVHCALDREEDAIKFLDQGVKAGCEDDDEWQRCSTALGWTCAYVAREKAHNSSPEARAFCDRVRAQAGLSASAHLMLANAYALLHEFDVAEDVCRKGMDVEPDRTDVDEVEKNVQDRQRLQEMLHTIGRGRKLEETRELFDQARSHMAQDRFPQAVALLDQAVSIDPESEVAYFLRSQCHLALNRIQEAKADVDRFKARADEDNLEAASEALERLEEDIQEREALVNKFGPEGSALRRQAVEAHNAGQSQRAVDHLRKALENCPPAGQTELRQELASVLTNWAVGEVNKAMENKNASHQTRAQVCRDMLRKIEEASRLDPESSHVKQNLNSLKELLPGIAQTAEMMSEFGSERVLELRAKGIKAFNEDKHMDAIKWLREALAASGGLLSGSSKLKEELSMVLTAAAVSMVNTAGQFGGQNVRATAAGMLDEALFLDPNNQQAKTNRDILGLML